MNRKKSPPRVAEYAGTVAAVHSLSPSPLPESILAADLRQRHRQLSLLRPDEILIDSGGTDSWCTPPELYEPVLDFLGERLFDLDPCSNAHSSVPARRIYTLADDGLEQDWSFAKSIWVNVPYSKPGPWVSLLVKTKQAERFALAKLDTSTRWFQPFWQATAILFLRERVRFLHQGERQAAANFANVLVYWGRDPEGFARELDDLGVVVLPEFGASRGAVFRRCILPRR